MPEGVYITTWTQNIPAVHWQQVEICLFSLEYLSDWEWRLFSRRGLSVYLGL
jgi:hypothetical protein